MSGGRWEYGRLFDENEEALRRIAAGKTCFGRSSTSWTGECAVTRAASAPSYARDYKQNQCSKCVEKIRNCGHSNLIEKGPRRGFCVMCGADRRNA